MEKKNSKTEVEKVDIRVKSISNGTLLVTGVPLQIKVKKLTASLEKSLLNIENIRYEVMDPSTKKFVALDNNLLLETYKKYLDQGCVLNQIRYKDISTSIRYTEENAQMKENKIDEEENILEMKKIKKEIKIKYKLLSSSHMLSGAIIADNNDEIIKVDGFNIHFGEVKDIHKPYRELGLLLDLRCRHSLQIIFSDEKERQTFYLFLDNLLEESKSGDPFFLKGVLEAERMQMVTNHFQRKDEEYEVGKMKVYIRPLLRKTFPIFVFPNDSTDRAKTIIMEVDGPPPDQQRLIYTGKQLEDNHSLSDYNIRGEETIHLILRL
jgi:large subunit ribosomal protein L40e